mmetsp:Transcript_41681/g.67624  ORF Transcript_41681/g.67624 Transcript_41681/m.67624 type:complete len:215 (+) Transcript_41681:330-974(+)
MASSGGKRAAPVGGKVGGRELEVLYWPFSAGGEMEGDADEGADRVLLPVGVGETRKLLDEDRKTGSGAVDVLPCMSRALSRFRRTYAWNAGPYFIISLSTSPSPCCSIKRNSSTTAGHEVSFVPMRLKIVAMPEESLSSDGAAGGVGEGNRADMGFDVGALGERMVARGGATEGGRGWDRLSCMEDLMGEVPRGGGAGMGPEMRKESIHLTTSG